MKLWRTMLDGAKKGPQVFGKWHDGNGGTCAMGAIMLGCGHVFDSHAWYDAYRDIMERFPELRLYAECPANSMCTVLRPSTLAEVIMHLNDRHRWSRQRIAEWLSGDICVPASLDARVPESCSRA